MSEVAHYQVNTSFGSPPWRYVALLNKDLSEVGRIELNELERLPHLVFALDQLRGGKIPEWDDQSRVLGFGYQEVSSG